MLRARRSVGQDAPRLCPCPLDMGHWSSGRYGSHLAPVPPRWAEPEDWPHTPCGAARRLRGGFPIPPLFLPHPLGLALQVVRVAVLLVGAHRLRQKSTRRARDAPAGSIAANDGHSRDYGKLCAPRPVAAALRGTAPRLHADLVRPFKRVTCIYGLSAHARIGCTTGGHRRSVFVRDCRRRPRGLPVLCHIRLFACPRGHRRHRADHPRPKEGDEFEAERSVLHQEQRRR
mmetsp:Transcript_30120/g.98024  ORF Transcript_30120/g.98024 Transcript_30120/m.98024 type:complete len:230 (+) Transcript_30120:619-1308(+)